MEIEENRGIINKKASEDYFMAFDQFLFGALILSLSLSLSLSLLHTEFSWSTLGGVWHTWDLEQDAKEEQENTRGHQDQQ